MWSGGVEGWGIGVLLSGCTAILEPMSAARTVHQEVVERESSAAQATSTLRCQTFVCDHCSRTFGGPPAGSGLLIWTRGEEVRYEEPPLCDDCAMSVTTAALMGWSLEGEED